MSSLSVKNLKNYVVLGIAVAAAYWPNTPAPSTCWSTPINSWPARERTPIFHRKKRIPEALLLPLPNSSDPIPTI